MPNVCVRESSSAAGFSSPWCFWGEGVVSLSPPSVLPWVGDRPRCRSSERLCWWILLLLSSVWVKHRYGNFPGLCGQSSEKLRPAVWPCSTTASVSEETVQTFSPRVPFTLCHTSNGGRHRNRGGRAASCVLSRSPLIWMFISWTPWKEMYLKWPNPE